MGLYTVLKPCLKGENTNITKNDLKFRGQTRVGTKSLLMTPKRVDGNILGSLFGDKYTYVSVWQSVDSRCTYVSGCMLTIGLQSMRL